MKPVQIAEDASRAIIDGLSKLSAALHSSNHVAPAVATSLEVPEDFKAAIRAAEQLRARPNGCSKRLSSLLYTGQMMARYHVLFYFFPTKLTFVALLKIFSFSG